MKKSNTLRYLLVALIAAACGVGGTYTVNHLRQQMEYVKVILPQPEIAAQRRKEIEWVAENRAELHAVLYPLIEAHSAKRENLEHGSAD